MPTSTSGDVVYNMMISDLFSWLAVNDPNGGNPNTKQAWDELARLTFYDSVNHGPQPYGTVGFLTNMYPTTETKALGWMQLFQDRTALYLADSSPSPAPCDYSLSPSGQNFGTSGGTGTVNVTAPGGCAFSAASNASWITIAPAVAAAPGTLNGVVNYSVTPNTSPNTRTGTLTIAGRTFTVNLDAAEGKLAQAKEAFAKKDYEKAGALAEQASVDAEYAQTKATTEKNKKAVEGMRKNIDTLRQEIERLSKN